MLIDDRVKKLMDTLPYLHKSEGGVEGFQKRLRLAMLEVAYDQRYACAKALCSIRHGGVRRDGILHYAVMNAEVK